MNATPFPCGNCLPCKINKSIEWKHRIMVEASFWADNVFLTLTYNDASIPRDWSLSKRDLQLFLKKFRKSIEPNRFRYFAIGEYGTKNERPHYHIMMFNVSPVLSELIEKKWGQGFIQVGTVENGSAEYVTQYCVKKLTDKRDHRLNGRQPEFFTSSKKGGGIGFPAIKEMAKKIKKNKYFDLRTIRTLGSRRKQPLGKYLTKKLADELEVPLEIREQELWDYQATLWHEHGKSGDFKHNLVIANNQKRLSQFKKHQIHKAKRDL